MKIVTNILITVFSVLLSIAGYSQSALQGVIEKLQANQKQDLQEKLFVHLDRTFYSTGENIWFKVYVVDGYTNQLLDISKVAYLEVVDRNQQPVIQTKIKLEHGKGNGVVSIPVSVESDNYTVRAYTNWMKNFSPEFYFHQAISIVNLFQRLEEKKLLATNAYDVQFFPESGHLVEGVKSKVAFRAVNALGQGIEFNGVVLTQQGDTLTKFSPLKYGIGHFMMTPIAGENYRVVIKEKQGGFIQAKLPDIQKNGYSMFVRDTTQNRIKITISTKEENQSVSTLYFVGHTHQVVKVATTLNISGGKVHFMINKKDLGEGVAHLTLFNQSVTPVCERLYYNKSESKTRVELSVNQKEFQPRSKVSVQLTTSEKKQANISLSVFKNDSLQKFKQADLESYLWLTSELKGNIESPEYYFSNDAAVNEAIDNLMLTHGWSRFSWDEVLHSTNKPLRFQPEYHGHLITGTVKGINTAKPLTGIPTYLSAPDKKIQLNTAYSQADGKVIFETTNLYGTKKLIAQTGAFKDSARIEINSSYASEFASRKLPPFKLSTGAKSILTERSISMQAEDIYHRGRLVTSKGNATDSIAFYGNAPEHYLLDDYTRFPLIEEVLREYVKGVRLRKRDDHFTFKVLNTPKNVVFENEPLILLDGVAVFNTDKIMEMDPLKIKSIDVVTNLHHYGNFTFEGIVSFQTYKHDLDGFQFDPGTVIIDYEGLQTRKEFFSPKYDSQGAQQNRLPDLRNLLLWIPDFTIDNTQQNIEFYSSDLTGNFQIIMQGLTADGKPIYETGTFQVRAVNP